MWWLKQNLLSTNIRIDFHNSDPIKGRDHLFQDHHQLGKYSSYFSFLWQIVCYFRIDTCIVGDDSTCDQAQNEQCSTENGVSSCNCRPGYARRKHRDPCRKVVSLLMSLRVDRIYERRVAWDKLLSDFSSEPYQQLSYESLRAVNIIIW